MRTSPKKYAQTLVYVIKDGMDPHKAISNIISILSRRRQARFMENFEKFFEKEWNEANGIVDITVYYPSKFKDSLKEIESKLTEKLGKAVQIHAKPDDKLIGGYRVMVGNTLIDASLENNLRHLASQFNH